MSRRLPTFPIWKICIPYSSFHINHLPPLYSHDTYETPYTNKDPARSAITSAECHSSRQSRSDCLPLASKTITQVSEPVPRVHIPPPPQHQIVYHCRHLQHAEDFLVSLTVTLHKCVTCKFSAVDEQTTISSGIAQHPQE